MNNMSMFTLYTSSLGNYFFNEIRDLVKEGLSQIGFSVQLADETQGFLSDTLYHVVIAPHEFFYLGQGEALRESNWPEKVILINTEQPSTKWFALAFDLFSKAYRIWDINHWAAKEIQAQGIQADYLPLGFVPDFHLFCDVTPLPKHFGTIPLPESIRQRSYLNEPFIKRPIDILFVGNLSHRRETIISSLGWFLSRYHCFFHFSDSSKPVLANVNTYMNTSTVIGLSQRTKILLNLHRGEDLYFEWQRIVMQGIWQRTLVISEPCEPAPPFVANKDYVEAANDELLEKLHFFLSTPQGQLEAQKIIDHGYKTLTEDCRIDRHLQGLVEKL
ncbi:MAG: hypothetical protein ANABAC_2748 [Anaerolineae bacterium]|nr:MAG: hypothetical protein ANABAC_2748 [Anaerolineae bacterium]